MDVTVLIFLLIYVALGFGHLTGFKVGRTGTAIGCLRSLLDCSLTAAVESF